MVEREKVSDEAKVLLRAYALHVARKEHPDAEIHVHVGDYLDDEGRVERFVTVDSETPCNEGF